MEPNNKKSKATLFLERNEIWFKTVLSLAVTAAALFVSMASCSNSRYQAQLTAASASQESREKNPFFSIEQYYDKEREQYIYGIINTGGRIRQCHVELHPYLRIRQEEKSDIHVSSPLESPIIKQNQKEAFIYLPMFYTPEDSKTFENCVLAFSDVWMDETISHSFPEMHQYAASEFEKPELADSYFRDFVITNNIDELETEMASYIEYYIAIDYYNFENTSQRETLWLRRGTDAESIAVGAGGNQVLYYSKLFGENEDYVKAREKGYTYVVDSLNLPLDVVASECKEIIADILIEFGQVSETRINES